MRVGVLVPCRNEATVIARKMRSLARSVWPSSAAPHHVVVIDDGSNDSTAAVASSELGGFDGERVVVRVIRNVVRPGKSGAIEAGLRELAGLADLIVLTDADVVNDAEAIVATTRAFELDSAMTMACGAQRFVASLPEDGSTEDVVSDDTFYDSVGARVRAFESRFGLVFSVQGQWMAWRAELGFVPTAGIAADDLDLMLQARCGGGAIRRIAQAVFFEVRAPRGPERDRQMLRRARAFVQFLGHPRLSELRRSGSWLARRQVESYLRAGRPGALWSVLPLAATALGGMWWGPYGAFTVIVLVTALFGPFWVLLRRVRSRIEAAMFVEARHALADSWETSRR